MDKSRIGMYKNFLTEMREEVREKAEVGRGTQCPCCDKLVKVYRRKLHAEMSKFLILLVNKYRLYPRWYGMRDLYPGNNKAASDGSFLLHWELIERSQKVNTAQAPVGHYRPTTKGMQFVYDLTRVPSHVHLLNNKVVGWSDKSINIIESLGKQFNYHELMDA